MLSYLIAGLVITVIWSLIVKESFPDFLKRFGFVCLFDMLIYLIFN